MALHDFDNCFSIQCESCPSTFFCAWCLTHVCHDGEESHEHVRVCAENPHPGAIYGDYRFWQDVHLPRKRRKRVSDAYGELCRRTSDVMVSFDEVERRVSM